MTSRTAVKSDFCITIDNIRDAADRIGPHIVCTPVIDAWGLRSDTGCDLKLKCENLQLGAAFKARGATNAVFSLTEEEARRGVVTHSSGNHAAALARAAVQRSIPAHVVMPRNSARVKLDAVRRLGVEPILCEPDAASREQTAGRVQQETGAVLIHPFNHPQVIAGQGTAALEILQQVPDADIVVVPVGGGGLLAGTLIAVKSLRPEIQVIAAEPAWADDAFRSWKSGRIEPALRTDSVADGLRTPLGSLTFPVISQLVDEILLADEASILRATALLANQVKLLSEPSGAVSVAVVLQHQSRFIGRRVVALISGGNLDDFRLLTNSVNP